MADRTTARRVRGSSRFVVRVTYPFWRAVLENRIEKDAYTAGIYGWNADAWRSEPHGVDGVAVVYGDRPFGTTVKCEKKWIRLAERLNARVERAYKDAMITEAMSRRWYSEAGRASRARRRSALFGRFLADAKAELENG